MEMMMIIVQEQDYEKLAGLLIRNRILATKFLTEGLYTNKKNITLMICIEKEREREVLEYVRQSCTDRYDDVFVQVWEYNGKTMVDVVRNIKIGGATVIISDVDRVLKY